MTSAAPGQQAVQGFANEQLRLRIDARGCFVQNQEARIVRQRARKIDELALPDRKS